MTKTALLGIFTVSTMVLAGCQQSTPTATEVENEPVVQADAEQAQGKKLSEIAGEILGGGAYECMLYDPEAQMQMSYVLQGKKVSMDIQSQGAEGGMSRFVSDGETTHIWDPASKKGMKVTALSEEQLEQYNQDGSTPEAPELDNPEELAELEQKYQTTCKPTVANAAAFAIPTDVEFQDMSQIMEAMQQFQPPQE